MSQKHDGGSKKRRLMITEVGFLISGAFGVFDVPQRRSSNAGARWTTRPTV